MASSPKPILRILHNLKASDRRPEGTRHDRNQNAEPSYPWGISLFVRIKPDLFSHIFKDVTGKKLQDYLVQIRLDKAKDLLRDIDLKVKQVAHGVGFTDPNYFCRTFKKRTGLSPTNWRLREILNHENPSIRMEVITSSRPGREDNARPSC